MVRQTVGQHLRATYFSLMNLSLTSKLLRGHNQYTRFLIIGRSRTGSTLLLRSLKMHKQAVIYGEVFRNNTINWQPQFGWVTATLHRNYLGNPISFLDERIFRLQPVAVKAVGFKLFYYHAHDGNLENVWDYVKRDKQLRVIHIKRKNILEAHLSRIVAGYTDTWRLNGKQSGGEQVPLALSVEECQQAFEETRTQEVEYDAIFADHPTLQMTYEDLSRDFANEMGRVQNFLALDHQPLLPVTTKQSKLPLPSRIANYAELKSSFNGTSWAEFFAE
jgi:LPS sulfotransferase NodH